MNNYKSIEAKIWNAVSALTSGILTSLIYESISNSSYLLDIEGKQYELTSTGTSFWYAIGIILVTFLFLWTVISVVIPLLLRIKQRFTYDRIKRVNARELIRTLDIAKDIIASLYPVFCSENKATLDPELMKLHNRDLAKVILLLRRKFLPNNQKLRKTVLSYFRYSNFSTVIALDKKVSSYEFKATIALLRKMVNNASEKGTDDRLLEKDWTQMKNILDELGELSEQVNNR